jgi:transketolase
MNETISKPFGTALVEHGKKHKDVVVITNDLTASCEADEFAAAFPDRAFKGGMAEQNLALTLSGFAREGMRPIYPSFAVFTTRRPYEQIALSIAYPNLPVRLVGFLPGLTTPGGVSHQAIDDIGLMKQLPNMTVIEASDASDMSSILEETYAIDGPVYIRALRGLVPKLHQSPISIGQSREIFTGGKVLVLVSGSLTATAINVVTELRKEFADLALININTIKPFGDPHLFAKIKEAQTVITYENHLVTSGLASEVAMHLAQNPGPRLIPVGINDTFTHGGGLDYLLNFYGIDAEALKNAIYVAYGKAGTSTKSSDHIGGKIELNKGVAEGL